MTECCQNLSESECKETPCEQKSSRKEELCGQLAGVKQWVEANYVGGRERAVFLTDLEKLTAWANTFFTA